MKWILLIFYLFIDFHVAKHVTLAFYKLIHMPELETGDIFISGLVGLIAGFFWPVFIPIWLFGKVTIEPIFGQPKNDRSE